MSDRIMNVISVLGAIASVLTAVVAYQQSTDAKRVAEDARRAADAARLASEVQAYADMRKQFYEVNAKLSTLKSTVGGEWEKLDIVREGNGWPEFKQYWYVSFDEWYATNKIGVFPELWSGYFGEAIADALKKKPFRA